MTRINFMCIVCYDKWFSLNHDKSLQIYVLCVKRHAKNDFLKDVLLLFYSVSGVLIQQTGASLNIPL